MPNLVHAVLAVLLQRALPGSSDVVLGYVVSGRDVPLVDGIGGRPLPQHSLVAVRP